MGVLVLVFAQKAFPKVVRLSAPVEGQRKSRQAQG
jgi:hypothetical protein